MRNPWATRAAAPGVLMFALAGMFGVAQTATAGAPTGPPAAVQASGTAAPTSITNIVYKTVAGTQIKLDLFFASAPGIHPLIIWVHGGGWQSGDKSNCLPTRLNVTSRGYHVACIDYRLSGQAIHPAQIEDVKSAIVVLRGRAAQYRLDPQRFAIWGSSAGGHLAALAGTTSGDRLFTTNSGASTVQAVVDYYGPTDLLALVQTPGYTSHQSPDSAESRLLGGPVLDNPQAADAASPITYASPADPPFFIVHGTADPVVPPQQSSLIRDALQADGVTAQLTYLTGAGHGGPEFSTPALTDQVLLFLQEQLG
ncbi:acetyl esterase/lipase [Allocatelliglobosispora scoriae]|uniref:Acetyl esterase/lipase n=1 Tax=Allocatelliglobosispora scoriae TaxID=643052 RepID=A0A841BII2_9ACTN|nr:alpha/beta hydrolase [Allocatelliglobosispora scoriae]MBB5868074.1 acetyl esterase/lipase [Allocatelliglobosispora scoriae]